MKIKPLPHQKDAIKAVINMLNKENRCHMVMACGTGKTATALWIAEKMSPKSIVIFVPSLALINQFMKEWVVKTIWEDYAMLAVCSDDTVTKGVEQESILWEEIDFPVSNDKDKIIKFMKKKCLRIIFCTYQSAYLLEGLTIDLGIYDEAHKTAGYNKRDFAYSLRDSNIYINKRLFMTATPRHGSPRKNKQGESIPLYSMNDELIYGKRAYTLGFREAINLGLICDYTVIISMADYSSEHRFKKDYEMQEKAISLKKAITETGVKKIICFHSTITDANYFAKYLKDHNIHKNICHISARSKMSDRIATMQLFREADSALITNARCLTEGVDVPSVDMVAFMSPKTSKIDIVQAIGRALRNSPGKKVGYIFLPLLIDNNLIHE